MIFRPNPTPEMTQNGAKRLPRDSFCWSSFSISILGSFWIDFGTLLGNPLGPPNASKSIKKICSQKNATRRSKISPRDPSRRPIRTVKPGVPWTVRNLILKNACSYCNVYNFWKSALLTWVPCAHFLQMVTSETPERTPMASFPVFFKCQETLHFVKNPLEIGDAIEFLA